MRTMYSRPILGVLLLVWSLSSPALGQEDRDYDLFGQWRFILSHAQDFPLNAVGEPSGLNLYLDHQLRVGTVQPISDSMEFTGELEIFYGQVDGDFDTVGAGLRDDERQTLRGWDLKQANLRQLWLSWQGPWFLLRAGQMGSHWGLGLLANDGRPQPDRFGFSYQGDLSDRVLLVTRPLANHPGWLSKVVTAVGGGVVYQDENTNLREGDLGGELILSALYREEGVQAGLYLAGRFQSDHEGSVLNVAALDLFGAIDAGDGHQGLVLAGELAFLAGKTDRVIHADRLDGLEVLALGVVARAGFRFELLDLLTVLEVGFASGDANPYDDVITSFSFDPNYKVGLVLFDTVLRGITAMAAAESSDPERIGVPIRGTDQLPSEGRVGSVFYLFPTVRLKPIEPLTLMAGVLYAWDSVPFSQSYQTFKNGGVLTNPYGLANPGHDLGLELDIGADWDQKIRGDFHLVAGIQAGWLFPGGAFDRPDGTRPGIIAHLLSRVALVW